MRIAVQYELAGLMDPRKMYESMQKFLHTGLRYPYRQQQHRWLLFTYVKLYL